MKKFIHCADLHLDSKMQTNLSPLKAQQRQIEILNTFECMADYAKKNNIDGIIIAGDMFDTANVSSQVKLRVLNTITKYPEIEFLYLPGNHDECNFVTQLKVRPENLKIFNDKWQYFHYENVTITGCTFDENHSLPIADLTLQPDDYNIVVLHGDINDRKSIDLDKLKNRHIDYLALGHIHTFEQSQLDERGIYCYSGCLEGRGFDECGDKGFVLLSIDTKNHHCDAQFVPFAKRQLVEIRCDITDCADWFAVEDKILAETENIVRDNLIKIKLVGRYNVNFDKQIAVLENKLQDFYAVKISDETTLELKPTDYQNDISLRGEFMRMVMASDLSDSEKEKVIMFGTKALAGEKFQ